MSLEDRLRAALRRRAEIESPDERRAWETISGRGFAPQPSLIRRAAIAAAALAIGVAAIAFVATAFGREPGDPPSTQAGGAGDQHELHVNCADGQTTVGSEGVVAQPDGVHVQVIGGPRPALVQFEDAEGARHGAWVRDDRGVVTTPPGEWEVSCGSSRHAMASVDRASVEIVDPAGVWIDGTLDCEITDLCNGIGTLRLGPSIDEISAIRKAVPGIDSVDVIEPSGYPDAAGMDRFRTYRIVRDGRVIGSVAISDGPDGLGAFWAARACKDTSLGQALLHN